MSFNSLSGGGIAWDDDNCDYASFGDGYANVREVRSDDESSYDMESEPLPYDPHEVMREFLHNAWCVFRRYSKQIYVVKAKPYHDDIFRIDTIIPMQRKLINEENRETIENYIASLKKIRQEIVNLEYGIVVEKLDSYSFYDLYIRIKNYYCNPKSEYYDPHYDPRKDKELEKRLDWADTYSNMFLEKEEKDEDYEKLTNLIIKTVEKYGEYEVKQRITWALYYPN